MNEKLIEISELQDKLKELMTDYTNRTNQIKQDNEDRIEAYYSQIMSFIAEHFKPYERFYKSYCNAVHDIASVWVSGGSSSNGGDWVRIRASKDWSSFYFINTYWREDSDLGKVEHKRIVLGWQRIKEDFLEGLEKHKNDYFRTIEGSRRSAEELSKKLDDFQI